MANDNDNVDVPATLGAILLGSLCAAVFSGVISTQAVAYFMVYLDDRRQIKALAITIWILDVCHTAFIWTACWFYLITNFGNSSAIDHIRWSIALTILFTAFTTTIVHCFLAHRIYLLSKRNLFLIVPILSLAGVRLVSAAVTAGEMLNINSFSEFDDDLGWLFTLGLAVLVCTDIIITSSLVILLRMSRTHAPSSINDVVNTLIRYAFEAATLTCVGAIVSLVCWLSMQENLIFLGVYFVISKFYAISFFATLNARRRLRQSHSLSSSDRRHGFPLRVESPATFKRPDPSSQSPSSRLQPSSEGSPVQRPLEVIIQREVEEVDRGRSP